LVIKRYWNKSYEKCTNGCIW